MKALGSILLVVFLTNVASAEELRLTAAEAFRDGRSDDVRLSADGKSVEMIRGILLHNDGPAAGYSYKPNEEVLKEGVTAYLDLQLWHPAPV